MAVLDVALPVLWAALWLAVAVESLGALWLMPAALHLGPRAVALSREEGPALPLTPGRGQTPRLRYRVLDTGEVLFRRKWFVLEMRTRTGLDPKGCLERDGGVWVATGRLPVAILGIYAWFGLVLVAGVVSTLVSGRPTQAIAPAIFLVLLFGFTWYAAASEIGRFPDLVDELVLGLEVYSAPSAGTRPAHRADALSVESSQRA